MKRSLLFVTSAIAFGALSGFLVSDFTRLSAKLAPAFAAVLPKAAAHNAPAKAVKVAATTTAFGRLINSTVAVVSPSRASQPVPVGSLVLNQPVVMLQAGGQPSMTIPQGAPVSLVKNDGRFMSVRHDQSVLTIPRSAVGVAVVRSN